MKGRLRRYLGCLGVLAGIVAVLAAVNLGVSWYYWRAAVALTPDGYPRTYKELLALHNRPDGTQNGAQDLLQAFEKFNDADVNYELLPVIGTPDAWPEPGEPFQPEVLAEMNKLVSMNRESLALLQSGVRAETVRFPMLSGIEGPFPLEQFAKVRNAGRLLVVSAMCAAESVDVADAIDSLETALLLGERYGQQSLLCYFAGGAVLGIGTSGAQSMIERDWLKSDSEFDMLSTLLDKAQPGDFAYAHWTENLWAEAYADFGDSIMENAGQAIVDETAFDAAMEMANYLVYRLTFRNEVHALNMRKELVRIPDSSRLPLNDAARDIVGRFESQAGSEQSDESESALLVNNLAFRMVMIEGQYRSTLRAMATAVRVAKFRKTFGRLPDEVEYQEIVNPSRDPMNGEALRYRVTDDGFKVYSVGPNGRDDGGTRAKETGDDDFVIEIRLPL